MIKGVVRCRQTITAVDTLADGARTRCVMGLEEALVLVEPVARRPFQGWRYLDPADAPRDLDPRVGAELPAALTAELRALGAW